MPWSAAMAARHNNSILYVISGCSTLAPTFSYPSSIEEEMFLTSSPLSELWIVVCQILLDVNVWIIAVRWLVWLNFKDAGRPWFHPLVFSWINSSWYRWSLIDNSHIFWILFWNIFPFCPFGGGPLIVRLCLQMCRRAVCRGHRSLGRGRWCIGKVLKKTFVSVFHWVIRTSLQATRNDCPTSAVRRH